MRTWLEPSHDGDEMARPDGTDGRHQLLHRACSRCPTRISAAAVSTQAPSDAQPACAGCLSKVQQPSSAAGPECGAAARRLLYRSSSWDNSDGTPAVPQPVLQPYSSRTADVVDVHRSAAARKLSRDMVPAPGAWQPAAPASSPVPLAGSPQAPSTAPTDAVHAKLSGGPQLACHCSCSAAPILGSVQVVVQALHFCSLRPQQLRRLLLRKAGLPGTRLHLLAFSQPPSQPSCCWASCTG